MIALLIGLVLSVFGAGWLNVQMLKHYLDAKIDGLRGEMNARFDAQDQRIVGLRGEMNARFDAQNQFNVSLAQRVERIEKQIDRLYQPVLPK
jgi:hypothetical protein